jgi:hypothetical protein
MVEWMSKGVSPMAYVRRRHLTTRWRPTQLSAPYMCPVWCTFCTARQEGAGMLTLNHTHGAVLSTAGYRDGARRWYDVLGHTGLHMQQLYIEQSVCTTQVDGGVVFVRGAHVCCTGLPPGTRVSAWAARGNMRLEGLSIMLARGCGVQHQLLQGPILTYGPAPGPWPSMITTYFGGTLLER